MEFSRTSTRRAAEKLRDFHLEMSPENLKDRKMEANFSCRGCWHSNDGGAEKSPPHWILVDLSRGRSTAKEREGRIRSRVAIRAPNQFLKRGPAASGHFSSRELK